ncbi:MAG TPA: hypothetical protein PKN96_07595 [Flavobacterium sp.]|uniref:hypothetical protein n=1 Tax=Flavobacterium sp. TaxID=239 RepID=UPI002C8AEC9B|nr:hypothetical protein [Flavobacterium sp.]HNP33141.1 hypothetical protein [Flavobacterium sp.]
MIKKILRTWPLFLFILLLDRFFFLPGRMDGTWQYDEGAYIETPINFSNIEIKNNFEVRIHRDKKSEMFYLLGCYFGRLYLLNEAELNYTKLIEFKEMEFID